MTPGFMGLVEGARDLLEDRDQLRWARALAALEAGAEIFPAEQLHHEEGGLRVLVDANVEHLHEVLALDPRRHDPLAGEARPQIVVEGDLRQHHLEGPLAPRVLVQDLVHHAHAAGADHAHDLVAASREGRARLQELHSAVSPPVTAGSLPGERRGTIELQP
jgi:hypothetical protein